MRIIYNFILSGSRRREEKEKYRHMQVIYSDVYRIKRLEILISSAYYYVYWVGTWFYICRLYKGKPNCVVNNIHFSKYLGKCKILQRYSTHKSTYGNFAYSSKPLVFFKPEINKKMLATISSFLSLPYFFYHS